MVCLFAGSVILAVFLDSKTATAQTSRRIEKEIRANRIILAGENGKGFITMDADKDGCLLLLYDEHGKPRVTLGLVKDGPLLDLCDENGKSLLVYHERRWNTPDPGMGALPISDTAELRRDIVVLAPRERLLVSVERCRLLQPEGNKDTPGAGHGSRPIRSHLYVSAAHRSCL